METTRWINQSHPQTLQNAVILLYMSAALSVLFGGIPGGIGVLYLAGSVAGGFGIANDKRWGYQLAVGVAALPFVAIVGGIDELVPAGLISLVFDVLLLVLLLHPDSRSYQRIWFE